MNSSCEHTNTLVKVSLLCCSVVMLDIRYDILLVKNFHSEIYLFFIPDVMIQLLKKNNYSRIDNNRMNRSFHQS